MAARTAGMRTNVLVAVGSAAFADLGLRLYGADGATRIVGDVVSGALGDMEREGDVVAA